MSTGSTTLPVSYLYEMLPILQVAIEQNHIFMNQHLSNGSLSDSGAEDLSIRSHGNSNDSFSKPESPQRYENNHLSHAPISTWAVFPTKVRAVVIALWSCKNF